MQIYLARNNVQAGPYTLDQLNTMLASQEVVFTDLMWHENMDNWQPVGTMTNNTLTYYPRIITRLPPPASETQEISQPASTEKSPSSWLKKTPSLTKTPQKTGIDISHAKKQLDLAPIGSRIIAKLIDFLLVILASLPLYLALSQNPNFDKLMEMARSGTSMFNNSQAMALMADIPSSTIILTDILILGLLIAQTFLLLRRGQSIGKMVMGIRILDRQSNAIPTFTNLILLRTILPIIIYTISLIGQLFLMGDFVSMLVNKDRLSLHDKIAKTYVVRADDTQTTPLELEPTE